MSEKELREKGIYIAIYRMKSKTYTHSISKKTNTQKWKEWKIVNGMGCGQWTSNFGSHCIADTCDCKNMVFREKEDNPDYTIQKIQLVIEDL